jgi:hypothetical protein
VHHYGHVGVIVSGVGNVISELGLHLGDENARRNPNKVRIEKNGLFAPRQLLCLRGPGAALLRWCATFFPFYTAPVVGHRVFVSSWARAYVDLPSAAAEMSPSNSSDAPFGRGAKIERKGGFLIHILRALDFQFKGKISLLSLSVFKFYGAWFVGVGQETDHARRPFLFETHFDLRFNPLLTSA